MRKTVLALAGFARRGALPIRQAMTSVFPPTRILPSGSGDAASVRRGAVRIEGAIPPAGLPRGTPTRGRIRAAMGLAALVGVLGPSPGGAQEPPGGRRGTGLPVPRYVSLKTDRVNLREGPSKDHRTAWVFQRAGLPVEIVAEFETWRRIRDSEGTEGWVLHSLLSGRRTALVMPWAKAGTAPIPLLDRADDRGGVVARLQPSVIANIKDCTGMWCRVLIARDGSRDVEGYIRQDKLWGVYPDERVE